MAKKSLISRMKSKFLGGGLLFLSNISLVSVGFSAWSIGTVGSAEAQITVGVDNVYDFIYNDPSYGMKLFSLGNDGFIQDGMVLTSINVSYYFKINAVKFKGVSNGKNSAGIGFSLIEEKPILVNADYLAGTYSYDSKGNGTFANSGNLEITNGIASGAFEVNDISGEEDVPFAIRFVFSINDSEKYVSLMDSLTDSSYFSFVMKVTGEPR